MAIIGPLIPIAIDCMCDRSALSNMHQPIHLHIQAYMNPVAQRRIILFAQSDHRFCLNCQSELTVCYVECM